MNYLWAGSFLCLAALVLLSLVPNSAEALIVTDAVVQERGAELKLTFNKNVCSGSGDFSCTSEDDQTSLDSDLFTLSVTDSGGKSKTVAVTKAALVDTKIKINFEQSNKIVLTVNPSLADGDTIKIKYSGHDGSHKRELLFFSDFSPARSFTHIIIPLVLKSASADGAELTLTYDKVLDGESEPAADAFEVTVTDSGGDRRDTTVTGVEVSGTTVVLTLEPAVEHGDTVTVTYEVPDENPIRDNASKKNADALNGREVSNDTAEEKKPTTTDNGGSDGGGSGCALASGGARGVGPGMLLLPLLVVMPLAFGLTRRKEVQAVQAG